MAAAICGPDFLLEEDRSVFVDVVDGEGVAIEGQEREGADRQRSTTEAAVVGGSERGAGIFAIGLRRGFGLRIVRDVHPVREVSPGPRRHR